MRKQRLSEVQTSPRPPPPPPPHCSPGHSSSTNGHGPLGGNVAGSLMGTDLECSVRSFPHSGSSGSAKGLRFGMGEGPHIVSCQVRPGYRSVRSLWVADPFLPWGLWNPLAPPFLADQTTGMTTRSCCDGNAPAPPLPVTAAVASALRRALSPPTPPPPEIRSRITGRTPTWTLRPLKAVGLPGITVLTLSVKEGTMVFWSVLRSSRSPVVNSYNSVSTLHLGISLIPASAGVGPR